jgi:hypothetical protein
MKYLVRDHDEEEEWENRKDIWEDDIIHELPTEDDIETEEDEREEDVESDEEWSTSIVEQRYVGRNEVDNTSREKRYTQKYRGQSDTKYRKTQREKERIIDSKYMHSDSLLEEIEDEENYRDLQEEPEKAVSKSEIEEILEKSWERIRKCLGWIGHWFTKWEIFWRDLKKQLKESRRLHERDLRDTEASDRLPEYFCEKWCIDIRHDKYSLGWERFEVRIFDDFTERVKDREKIHRIDDDNITVLDHPDIFGDKVVEFLERDRALRWRWCESREENISITQSIRHKRTRRRIIRDRYLHRLRISYVGNGKWENSDLFGKDDITGFAILDASSEREIACFLKINRIPISDHCLYGFGSLLKCVGNIFFYIECVILWWDDVVTRRLCTDISVTLEDKRKRTISRIICTHFFGRLRKSY